MTKTIAKTVRVRITSVLLIITLLGLTAVGCGSDRDQAGGRNGTERAQEEGVSYVAEELDVPHENIMSMATYQNTLYYLNQDVAEDGKLLQTIYRMDMGTAQGEATAVPITLEEGQVINYLTVDETGKLHIMFFKADENASATLTDVGWVKLDEAGNTAASVSLLQLYKEKGEQIPTDFEVDKEGNIYVSMNDTVYVADPEGNLLYEALGEGMISFLGRDDAGKIYAVWYSIQADAMMGMAEVDAKIKALGPTHNLPVSEIMLGIGTGAEGKLLLATSSSVLDYDIQEKTVTERFQWAALDVSADYFGLFQSLADGRALWLGRAFQEDGTVKSTLMMVRPRREGEVVQEAKKTLTFGGISLLIDAVTREAIVAFNRTDPDYRIEIIEYGADDLAAGLEQLNADIVSGDCPDIMALPLGYSLSMYSSKGVLEDMNPLMENDESINRVDFQENILNAFETDGKLYGIPTSFMIYSIMAPASLTGELNAWKLDEMVDVVDRIGDDSNVFAISSKSAVLSLCMMANNELIVNWNDQEKGFDREVFIKMLEFANRFVPDDRYVPDDANTLIRKLAEGDIQLMETAMMNMSVHQLYSSLFGEQINYVGYPSEKGNGSLAGSTSLLAISKQCSDKEAAWRFISSMLSEEYQESPSMVMGFPIRKSSLEKLLEKAKEVTYTTDENGNQQEATIPITMGEVMVELHAAKEEDVQAVRSLIESVDKMQDPDSQIATIISEEAQTYFSGDKSVEEVVDVVENRIQLYMEEIG